MTDKRNYYVAILCSENVIYGSWRDPDGDYMPYSAPFATDAQLAKFFVYVHLWGCHLGSSGTRPPGMHLADVIE